MSKSNAYDPEVLKLFVGELERHQMQLESYKGEHMQRCKTVRGHMSDVYDRASDAGIPKRMLKARMKASELEQKAKAVRDNLEEEERDDYDMIRDALGDFADSPLGAASLQKAEKKQSKPDPLDVLATDPDATAANENAKKLKGGIKTLN